MDAKYLQNNVNTALSEALSAMVASQPADSIEFIGKYLLQYVDRQQKLETDGAREAQVEAFAAEEAERDKVAIAAANERKFNAERYDAKLHVFVENLSSSVQSKQAAMEAVTNFAVDYLNIPACYIGVVRKNGESESLNYYSANKGQDVVLGKKLMKPVDTGDEAPPRQGISFDTFKVPEVTEEEVQLEEGQEPPPKVVPTPQPIVIDDVMRDNRIKFFGIPKIGSFASIPLKYLTFDHENAVVVGSTEYSQNPIPQNVLLCLDTIGKYREFKSKDIAVAQRLGAALISTFEAIELSMFNKHATFLGNYKPSNGNVTGEQARISEAEASALAGVAGTLPAECAESMKACKETEASVNAWTEIISSSDILIDVINDLTNHLLPAPQAVSNLFYAIAILCGASPKQSRDVCGDVTWENIRANVVRALPKLIAGFKPGATKSVAKDTSLAAIKKFVEENNLYDTSIYPSSIAVCTTLSLWLQKAVNARAAAIAFNLETNVNLETK